MDKLHFSLICQMEDHSHLVTHLQNIFGCNILYTEQIDTTTMEIIMQAQTPQIVANIAYSAGVYMTNFKNQPTP